MSKKMSKQEVEFDLNVHTHHLLEDEPFWGALSREMTKRCRPEVKTAGVRVNPKTAQFELAYAPDFWSSLDVKADDTSYEKRFGRKGDKALLLMHEFYHCIFGHVTTRVPAGGMTQAWNIAMDLAINGELFNSHRSFNKGEGSLYEMGVIPGKPGSEFEKYPVGLTAEAYYEMMKKDPQFEKAFRNPNTGMGEGLEGFDNHEGHDEIDAETQIIAEQRLKQALKNAAESSMANGWGSISNSMKGEILALLKGTINWKAVLRYFVRTSQRSSHKSSIMSVNRRHPYVFPGRKSSRSAHIAIAIDQSGSVSDELLVAFFSELNGLASVADFTVIPFDHEVDESKIFKWKKGSRVNPERVLCGGTCFDAPTNYVNSKGNFDGLIILTDMMAPEPGPCNVQRMWGTSEEHAERPYFSTSERVMSIPLGGEEK